MRLHRLVLEAFGPFADRQDLDFEAVGASGLFLLEGPTGAGKTSILDAVTFALYGGLSGRETGADRQHSHFAQPQVEPFVELEFSVRGRRHRIRRTPEWQRPKRRSSGLTRQPAAVHLERREGGSGGSSGRSGPGGSGGPGGGWTSLSSNKAEVGELVSDLLGLNREQFTQVVLLPQGEFAQFLRANDDDRRALLTKIFGTGLYDTITAELAQRRTERQRAVEAARQRHRDRAAAAIEAAGFPVEDREEFLAGAPEIQRERFAMLEAELITAAERTSAEAARQESSMEAAAAAAGLASRSVELSHRRRSAQAALAAHLDSTADHELEQRRLADSRQVAGIAALINAADDQADRVVQAHARAQVLAPELDELIAGAGAAGLVPILESTVRELTRTADALTATVALEQSLPSRRDDLTAAESVAKTAAKKTAQLDDRQGELPGLIKAAKSHLDEARRAELALPAMIEAERVLAEQVRAGVELAAASARLETLRERRTAVTDLHQAAVELHQQLWERRLDGMAAELAGELKTRQPCAVCGSRAHPRPAQPMLDAVTADDFDRALAARREAEFDRGLVDEEWNGLTEQLAALRVRAGAAALGECSDELAKHRADLAATAEVAATRTEAEASLTEREVEETLLSANRQQAALELAASLSEVAACSERLEQAEAAVTDALDGAPSVNRRQLGLREQSGLAVKLVRAVAELAQEERSGRLARMRVENAASAAGFADLASVRHVVLTPAEQAALEDRVVRWGRDLEVRRAAVAAPELADVDPDAVAAYEKAASTALEQAEQARAAARAARTTATAATQRRDRFLERRADFDDSADTHEAATLAAADIVYLADLSRGMDGQQRMSLTTYVLRRWFEQVVEAANIRLRSMSSGRYVLIRTESSSRAGERVGLTLRVVDRHTGEERSTSSLSGGESFYTSLALALGLTDVVAAEAGGVEMDTLFIDEGFGSLDAETLDQVMAVIDELRDHGRVVGLVSHVAELKDRIQERVEVYRRPDGSSALRITA